jgi:tRNA-specific 2-thiouridylase
MAAILGKRARVVVAMSGGVDSAVAALILHRDGYDVVGVTMKLWSSNDQTSAPNDHSCCSVDDIEDARRVCQTIGIPHYVMNAEREFRTAVMDQFISQYQEGLTPHPCIMCNDRIKFDFLLERSKFLKCDYVATGHHARIIPESSNGEFRLFRGVDKRKDQSYVLLNMRQAQLGRVLLPVGMYEKNEIRDLALEGGLHLAGKPDSQEICFIPQGNYREFLRDRIIPNDGDFVDAEGNILGRHPGIEFFTIGQRRGLGKSFGRPLFVTALDKNTGQVTLGPEDQLFHRGVSVRSVGYIREKPLYGPYPVTAKLRYNGVDSPAELWPDGDRAVLWFDEPQRAISAGQAAVFYSGDEVLGGGVIDGPTSSSSE